MDDGAKAYRARRTQRNGNRSFHMDNLSSEMQNRQAENIPDEAEKTCKKHSPDSPEREEYYKESIKEILSSMKAMETNRTIWDFSKEKTQPFFACDCVVVIRPIVLSDAEVYVNIRMQYSMMFRAMIGTESHKKESLLQLDLCQPESFFCIIETAEDRVPIGYLGIKDTSADAWELAIELDKQSTNRGIGPRSIRLFLDEINRITGKTSFRATVEADNSPSQKCLEKLGAQIAGICTGGLLIKRPEDKERFEREHMDLIDDNMRALAARIGVEPQKLLTNVLDYRMEWKV